MTSQPRMARKVAARRRYASPRAVISLIALASLVLPGIVGLIAAAVLAL